jgi:hypothetical protein
MLGVWLREVLNEGLVQWLGGHRHRYSAQIEKAPVLVGVRPDKNQYGAGVATQGVRRFAVQAF